MFRQCFYPCCILLCLFATTQSTAQNNAYNYFYRNNWQLVNPAAIDRSHYLTKHHPTTVLNAGSRLQWLGLEGAPLLYFVSAEFCPESRTDQPNYKLGVTAYGDRTDAISTYGFYGNYSYFFVLPWGKGHTLHLGLSVGYVQYGVNLDRIHGTTHIADDVVLQNNQKRSYADFALGALYRIQKRFYLGISSPQTFGLNLSRDSIHANTIGVRQVNLTGGWFINRGDRDYATPFDEDYYFLFEPSFIVRYAPGVAYSTLKFLKNSPFSADVNLRVHYRRKFWYGGGLGTNGNINLEGGFNRDMGNGTHMMLGGGYGIPVFQRYQGLGHSVEVNFGYYFN